jgi:hypothetical protein
MVARGTMGDPDERKYYAGEKTLLVIAVVLLGLALLAEAELWAGTESLPTDGVRWSWFVGQIGGVVKVYSGV